MAFFNSREGPTLSCQFYVLTAKSNKKIPGIPPNTMEMEVWDNKSGVQETGDSNCIAYRCPLLIQTTICLNIYVSI
jgi:hypothetical protein